MKRRLGRSRNEGARVTFVAKCMRFEVVDDVCAPLTLSRPENNEGSHKVWPSAGGQVVASGASGLQ
jgi:hypothetical protein